MVKMEVLGARQGVRLGFPDMMSLHVIEVELHWTYFVGVRDDDMYLLPSDNAKHLCQWRVLNTKK